jgi:ketosteroid isomerase-like protein
VADNSTLRDVFESQMAAYAAGDTERLLASFSDDCVLQDMADPDNTFSGNVAIKGFLDDYFSTLVDASVKRTVVAAEGDTIVGELEVEATYIAEPFSRENGRRVTIQYCVIEKVRDGHVCFERFYWDSAALDRQLA